MTNAENVVRKLTETLKAEGEVVALALLKTFDMGTVNPALQGAAFPVGITVAALLQ